MTTKKKYNNKIFFHLFFCFWIRDPRSGMGKNQDPGSGIIINMGDNHKHPGYATLRKTCFKRCNFSQNVRNSEVYLSILTFILKFEEEKKIVSFVKLISMFG
jgi:hypothetical protein